MELALDIDDSPHIPLYRRLSDAVRKAISDGRLKPGDPLPSVRDLGKTYGISRLTVLKSYQDLQSQGYVETSPGAGSRVSAQLEDVAASIRPAASTKSAEAPARKKIPTTPFFNRIAEATSTVHLGAELMPELNYGLPTADQLPLAQWKKLLDRHCQRTDSALCHYVTDPRGLPELREALVAYLGRSRGLACKPEQIFLFGSLQHALLLLGRLLLVPDDVVAIENPGTISARRIFQFQQSTIMPLPVDEEGLCTDKLESLPDNTRIVYVTPSHQRPTGVVLSLARRLELLAWTRERGAIIVEDDNDSEFRYTSQPIPALQGLDEAHSVAYIQTFWKTLGPMIRMGFIIVPEWLVPQFFATKSLIEPDFPVLEQCALADFINEGLLERHIQALRKVYAKRRESLVHWLSISLGSAISISPESAGSFLLARFDRRFSTERILQAAKDADFPLASTSNFYIGEPTHGEYLIPFAHREEADIKLSTLKFAQSLNMHPDR